MQKVAKRQGNFTEENTQEQSYPECVAVVNAVLACMMFGTREVEDIVSLAVACVQFSVIVEDENRVVAVYGVETMPDMWKMKHCSRVCQGRWWKKDEWLTLNLSMPSVMQNVGRAEIFRSTLRFEQLAMNKPEMRMQSQ